MNKRQLKKKKKKCLPVIVDEFNLLTMTDDEREKAYKKYEEYVRRYSYRKKYKNLKGKHLVYFYPVGNQMGNMISEMSRRVRKRTFYHKN